MLNLADKPDRHKSFRRPAISWGPRWYSNTAGALSVNSQSKSLDCAAKRSTAQRIFSTPEDDIPENTFAVFLGPAKAAATV